MPPGSQEMFSESISNLSFDLLGKAILLLRGEAYRVYQLNQGHPRPPVAGTETAAAASAILLLQPALDYHLCRLKYLVDEALKLPKRRNLPPVQFKMDDYLPKKIERLLIQRHEQRLKELLIEFTAVRDSIEHAKIFTV